VRPLRLEIKGFTSFRDEQVIDFETLESPFAIVGPTGSGKSSVLDAMTYALYGEVDRVDERRTREMLSQGQPRMAVALEFEVSGERYRVTRSLQRTGGATKILVQRRDGDGWKQAGEGADRVRDANRILREAIGLDFDGFTRSVLLPQGKFSAFMSGDAKERREILTDLLGLNMFDRMGKRARQVAKEATDRAATYDELIASQFASATPEALAEAKRSAAAAEERQATLAAAADGVAKVAERWKSVADAVRELQSCAAEVDAIATAAAQHAATLESLAAESASADDLLRKATAGAEAATKGAEEATAAREATEERWGTAADLARVGERARALASARSEVTRRTAAVAAAAGRVPDASKAADVAAEELARAVAGADEATAALEAATAALREVEHADKVAALVGSLAVGDPCPVCGDPLKSIPASPGAKAVRDAGRAEQQARRRDADASARAAEARRALDLARVAVEAAEKEAAAAVTELAGCELTVTELESAVRESLGELPDDPPAVVEERAAGLQSLAKAERAATESAQAADRALREASSLRDRITSGARESRAGLAAVSVAAAAGRATAVDPSLEGPDEPALPEPDELPALAAAARGRAEAARRYGVTLAAAADDRAGSESEFLVEASSLVEGLVPTRRSLPDLMRAVAEAVNAAIREHEQRAGAVTRIEGELEKVASMREEAAGFRERGRMFNALAQELRADRLIAFLQAEALRLLAIGGSNRLAGLSGGRYELAYPDDEFLVVDKWNGDETRSVRTLSGGETFLASLALALALAEQVSSLAVTRHASLDSLFLDEGFGTLDPETLEVVVEAIEQLGGDGRMVGVITHVRDLADRMPARIEIEKSQRGSTVRQAG
jgi:exonuclease SbcC